MWAMAQRRFEVVAIGRLGAKRKRR